MKFESFIFGAGTIVVASFVIIKAMDFGRFSAVRDMYKKGWSVVDENGIGIKEFEEFFSNKEES